MADLDDPIIIIEHRDKADGIIKHIIIDGWHRIYKFVKHSERTEPLSAFILTQAEGQQIKIQ